MRSEHLQFNYVDETNFQGYPVSAIYGGKSLEHPIAERPASQSPVSALGLAISLTMRSIL